jgi:DNA-directed RNA polymerase specialized sigma24 family protein
LAWLDTQIRCLPLDIRRILELKHRDGKTCEQIAVDMGRPVGTIKSLLARTYKALRETIGASLVR